MKGVNNMALSRKYYKQFAEVIKDNTMNDTQPIINKKTFIVDLCVLLKHDNNNFDTQRFIDACGIRVGGEDNV